MAQRRHNFISGAAVLALAVAVTKVLGALYKIPLGNLLDKEGMAHFYAAYNIYNLLLVLSTAGLPLALSRLVSRAAAQGRLNAQRRIFRTALALLAVIGAVCSAVMCLFPQVLSGLLHDSLAAPAIRVLGPAVLFVCLTSAIRGYTQGLGDMTPTAVSQMTESAGKLVIGLALCLVLLHRGADSSLCAAGAIAGVTAGSLLSLTVLTVFLLRRRDRAAVDVPPARSAVLRELLTAGIPITLGAAGMSLITLLDQALVMSTLQNTLGYTEAAATALYGEYTFGMTLFALPPSFIYPVTVSLVPDISAALARSDRPAAGRSAAAALKLTTLIALPTGAGLSVPCGARHRRSRRLSPDHFGHRLHFRVPDGGHQRRPPGLRQRVHPRRHPAVRRYPEDHHQLPDGGRPRHQRPRRTGEHSLLLRAHRGAEPHRHCPLCAGAALLPPPVCQTRSHHGGDGTGRPLVLRPAGPQPAGALGRIARHCRGGGGLRRAGAGAGRRDAAGRAGPAER